MPKVHRVLLVGGGSGGHIVPNLAVATALKKASPTVQLLYAGSHYPLDARLVQKAGIPFRPILTGKLRRYFSLRNFVDPFLVIIGFFQSIGMILAFQPHVVFSKGGFVSFPVVLAAWLLRKPVILHESDRGSGRAHRLLAPMAKLILSSFDDAFEHKYNVLVTGNPIRPQIFGGDAKKGYQLTGFHRERPVLLVWGGSLGAQQINRLLECHFRQIKHDFQVIHITGKGKGITLDDPAYKAFEYVDEDLKHLYAITDIVVGRAGANSLFELAAMQKPNIVIPLMQNADQIKNAEYFENKGASLVLHNEDDFVTYLEALLHNPAKYKSMQQALQQIAKPDAAHDIADIILNYENRN